MTIGRFARLTGLSIHALRHYDDVSLLVPAHTDPQTGYRHYGHDQIRQAHLIRELRWIDLPIEEIRQVLAEAGQAGSVLAGHRRGGGGARGGGPPPPPNRQRQAGESVTQ